MLLRRIASLLMFTLVVSLQPGCNSVFYHPDSKAYLSPQLFNLKWEELEIPVDDSFVHAWKVFPNEPSKGTVVHFHGNAQNMTAHFGFSYWLPQNGYELVTFDYAGYGKSPGKPSQEQTVKDGVAVLNFVSKTNGGKDIFVLGQSLGGAIAFVSVAKAKDVDVRALVLESTFASYRQMARKKLETAGILSLLRLPLSFLVSDDEAPADFLNEVKIPILFFHGASDNVVPIEVGEKFFNRTVSNNKKFIRIDNAGHTAAFGNPDSPHRKTVLNFLCEHGSEKRNCF